jgi:topoisomerase IV subunit A
VVTGDKDFQFVVASDAGYGFVTQLGDMETKNKAGKSLITVPNGSTTLQPVPIADVDKEYVAAFSNEGRLLIFPVSELPRMARGKGIKIMNIPAARVADRSEIMSHIAVFGQEDVLLVYAGKRHLSLRFEDLAHYRGERARRGLKLPRGFQKVDSVVCRKAGAETP